ncbi:hypothetical protein [Hyphomicrobium sp.]|uniref:hypothetical protein n=1 Tax=Hyphomicrobium sp. TaxID=82 RepID=UPI0025BE78F2|nr:hypothetical protein [Hyphomicrobium sp.]MCC7251617.1 hypothetical protein [Hyphomicrobium sp.]
MSDEDWSRLYPEKQRTPSDREFGLGMVITSAIMMGALLFFSLAILTPETAKWLIE